MNGDIIHDEGHIRQLYCFGEKNHQNLWFNCFEI